MSGHTDVVNQLIGVKAWNFIHPSTIIQFYEIYDFIKSILLLWKFTTITDELLSLIDQKFSYLKIESNTGGKDTLLVAKMFIDKHEYVFKIYDFSFSEVLLYILSISHFQETMPEIVTIENNLNLKFRPLEIYAFGEIIIEEMNDMTMVIQELTHKPNYIDFSRIHEPPLDVVSAAIKFVRSNGYILDYMPLNYTIGHNKDENLYEVEYLDYFMFNDPSFMIQTESLATKIRNLDVEDTIFRVLDRL